MSRIYLSPPHVAGEERRLILDAIDSNWVAPLGPHVDGFEKEFSLCVDGYGCAALSSGTAALHLALIILGVRPGDEIITSTLTFSATANAIRYVGAIPVFLDSERMTWNMDPDLLEEALSAKQKAGRIPAAVVVVDLYGQCANYSRIAEICNRYKVPIVEDAAEALGASWAGRPAGTFGQIAAFSFNGNKIITTSGGGMLVSSNLDFVSKARFLATQARDPAAHYEHSEIGYNYRLSNLLAAVGRAQLATLSMRVEKRRSIFETYQAELIQLPGISFMPEPPESRSTRWLTCILLNPELGAPSPDVIRAQMDLENIEARPIWKPMHLQPVFSEFEHVGGSVAEELFRTGICLPSGSSLTESDQSRVIETIRRCWG